MSEPDENVHVVVREATAADGATIADLITQLGYRTKTAEMASRLEGILGQPGYATYVAELHQDVVGVVGARTALSYEREGVYAHVLVLSVDGKSQRLGIGRALLRAAEHWARRQGASRILVHSGKQRREAHAFYEHMGYSPTGIRFVKDLRSRAAGAEAADARSTAGFRGSTPAYGDAGEGSMSETADWRIRNATVADLEVILHHRRSMFADMGDGTEAELDAMVASSRPFVEAALRDGSYRAWLIEIDARVVAGGGIAVVPYQPTPLDPAARRAYVLNMYTEPEYRRRGLARRVLEAIVSWCREQGFKAVLLHASDAGRPLYLQMGFEPTNEMRLLLT